MKKPSKIFISHSNKNQDFVDQLVSDLKSHGLTIWEDDHDIEPGQNIPVEIQKGLRECDCVLVVLSDESLKSHWVLEEEVSSALMQQKLIIPIRVDACTLPPLLESRKGVDFFEYQKGLAILLKRFPITCEDPIPPNTEETIRKNLGIKPYFQHLFPALVIGLVAGFMIGLLSYFILPSRLGALTNYFHLGPALLRLFIVSFLCISFVTATWRSTCYLMTNQIKWMIIGVIFGVKFALFIGVVLIIRQEVSAVKEQIAEVQKLPLIDELTNKEKLTSDRELLALAKEDYDQAYSLFNSLAIRDIKEPAYLKIVDRMAVYYCLNGSSNQAARIYRRALDSIATTLEPSTRFYFNYAYTLAKIDQLGQAKVVLQSRASPSDFTAFLSHNFTRENHPFSLKELEKYETFLQIAKNKLASPDKKSAILVVVFEKFDHYVHEAQLGLDAAISQRLIQTWTEHPEGNVPMIDFRKIAHWNRNLTLDEESLKRVNDLITQIIDPRSNLYVARIFNYLEGDIWKPTLQYRKNVGNQLDVKLKPIKLSRNYKDEVDETTKRLMELVISYNK